MYVATSYNPEAPAARSHSVRFFENSDYPVTDIGDYLQRGLAENEAVLVYATEAHVGRIREALTQRGLDVGGLIESGRLVARDAEQLAAMVHTAQGPNENALHARLVEDVQRALEKFPRVRAYGEIVDVLAASSRRAAAVELEEWWNKRLVEGPRLMLRCGYAMESFADADAVAPFRAVCQAHAKVKPRTRTTRTILRAPWPSSRRRRLRSKPNRASAGAPKPNRHACETPSRHPRNRYSGSISTSLPCKNSPRPFPRRPHSPISGTPW